MKSEFVNSVAIKREKLPQLAFDLATEETLNKAKELASVRINKMLHDVQDKEKLKNLIKILIEEYRELININRGEGEWITFKEASKMNLDLSFDEHLYNESFFNEVLFLINEKKEDIEKCLYFIKEDEGPNNEIYTLLLFEKDCVYLKTTRFNDLIYSQRINSEINKTIAFIYSLYVHKILSDFIDLRGIEKHLKKR